MEDKKEDNNFMCDICEDIITSEEWKMFNSKCEECFLDQYSNKEDD